MDNAQGLILIHFFLLRFLLSILHITQDQIYVNLLVARKATIRRRRFNQKHGLTTPIGDL